MDFDTSFHMTIGGKPVFSDSLFDVLNPATEQVLAQAPDATRDHLDSAVAAARAAFPGWAATPIAERRALIDKLGDAVIAHAEDFKRLLTAEQGKPHADAFNEVMGAGLWLKGAATLDLPVTVNEDSADRYSETRRVPIGVVGAIAPWNFPMVLAMFKVGPALLAGNTMVLKPSPFTPLTTLKFGELAATILPPGVLNVVTGGDRLGPWLTEHPGIDKVSFTGSTATGRRVMQSASATLKRVTLELGGNDAAIVLPDADVEALAEQLFWAAFTNNGQICIATKRMYVHRDVYDTLKDALVAYARTVQIGDGAQQGVRLGPINNILQYKRVLDLIRDARDKGYRFLLGGEAADTSGYFVPITILDNPPEDSRIVQEEQFGPILPLLRFDDVDEVIERVNASEYGLGASIWTGDPDAAMELAARIASGTVWINETQHLTPLAAFGGMKQSGLGVEGGAEGLMEYTNAQTITRRR
ncbi:acyl-CoA reductase-like NAD-dependent aldehyde dehydrogenase [Sphingomonas sp. SORGH_AS870]|uniref:aldehyde dehydrogenase family protein n=1 Tax=Sphingomonas sp. SORGH_AS_0870 TaxID=3041801 RepID=UPI00285F564E|nr:aldehyde dehydrogenase family protein [Sphingomonas sp. SORGH_AS_0870]MDR6146507.1 acyl-CoA reductase-like NAD-dependent aldehyde dehydrogenase [Sphingomonas sp. SORGH_AS_0870]